MPGVLLIEGMAQTAGALCVLAQGASAKPKLVYFMTIDNAKFRQSGRAGRHRRVSREEDPPPLEYLEVRRDCAGRRREGRRGGSERHAGGRLSWRRFIRPPSSTPARNWRTRHRIGPYALISAGVRLAEGVKVHGHAVVAGTTAIGEGSADLPVRQRRHAAAGPEIPGRGEPAGDRPQLHDPRARHHQSRHRGRRSGHDASATTACFSSARMSRMIARSATTSRSSTTRRSPATAASATT